MTEEKKSKAAELLAAARARNEQAVNLEQEQPAKSAVEEAAKNPEVTEAKIAAAEEMAETRVQAKAGTMTGEIDVTAMGDVKGDGRDANEYPDTDPAKHLGVPTYEHGLNSTSPLDQPDDTLSAGIAQARTNSRREAEIARGRERIAEIQRGRDQAEARRTSDRESPFNTTISEPTPQELREAKKAKKNKAK